MVSSLLLPNRTICGGSRPLGHRVTANNAHQLGMAILYYSHDHNGSFPNKNTWCDDILDETVPVLFISPLDPEASQMVEEPQPKVSSYAFNAAASEDQLSHSELVILFESNLGWNGSGDLEEALGTLKAYDGKPIAVVFADGHVELISSAERLKQLMWNPKDSTINYLIESHSICLMADSIVTVQLDALQKALPNCEINSNPTK